MPLVASYMYHSSSNGWHVPGASCESCWALLWGGLSRGGELFWGLSPITAVRHSGRYKSERFPRRQWEDGNCHLLLSPLWSLQHNNS